MKRTIKKQIWINADEDKLLKEKAEKACLTEAAMIRMLIRGYAPKEKPDLEFYKAMNRITVIGNNLNQLVARANSIGFTDTSAVKHEIESLKNFRVEMEKRFLEPIDYGSN